MRSVRIPVLLVTLLLLSVVPLTEGNSSGKYSQSSGCSCHSQSGSTAATVSISGHPASYTPGSTYTLSISVTGGVSGTDGGFSLEASHGSLSTCPRFQSMSTAQAQVQPTPSPAAINEVGALTGRHHLRGLVKRPSLWPDSRQMAAQTTTATAGQQPLTRYQKLALRQTQRRR